MPNPSTDKPSIEKTLQDQHRLTMTVINAIKHDTESLMHKTDQIVEHLVDEGTPPRPFDPAAEMPPEPPIPAPPRHAPDPSRPPRPESPRGERHLPRLNPADGEFLVSEISRLCVKEVMETINPILEALNTFIKANGIGTAPPPETEDDLFAEKLIEQMKLAVGRRQKIAMARMKRSAS